MLTRPPTRLLTEAGALLAVLDEGRRRGLVGPGPLDAQLAHALGFADAVGWSRERDARTYGLDLGSGGGLPGLVLAAWFPSTRWTLLDSRRRSGDFLSWAVDELSLQSRVAVKMARAEEVGREPGHRGAYGLVVARGFGPPAPTAECAAPLLEPGGRLVVSEPPERAGERWPRESLGQLGLRLSGARALDEGHYAVLEQVAPCPARFPRRTGVPAKRPLFG